MACRSGFGWVLRELAVLGKIQSPGEVYILVIVTAIADNGLQKLIQANGLSTLSTGKSTTAIFGSCFHNAGGCYIKQAWRQSLNLIWTVDWRWRWRQSWRLRWWWWTECVIDHHIAKVSKLQYACGIAISHILWRCQDFTNAYGHCVLHIGKVTTTVVSGLCYCIWHKWTTCLQWVHLHATIYLGEWWWWWWWWWCSSCCCCTIHAHYESHQSCTNCCFLNNPCQEAHTCRWLFLLSIICSSCNKWSCCFFSYVIKCILIILVCSSLKKIDSR